MIKRLLSYLLWLANSDPPPTCRQEFYALKQRLLKRYANKVCGSQSTAAVRFEADLQHVRKSCWSCDGTGEGDYEDEACHRCAGTGVYEEFWCVLDRWDFCGRIFHTPRERLYRKPEHDIYNMDCPWWALAADKLTEGLLRIAPCTCGEATIEGTIKHPNHGMAAREAVLWLLLLCGCWRLWYRVLKGSAYCRWSWRHPLCNLQRVVMNTHLWLSRWKPRRCYWCSRLCIRPTGLWCRRCCRTAEAELPF